MTMDLTLKCYAGNEIITDHDSNNYTTEQLEFIKSVSQRNDFDYFIGGAISSTLEIRKRGPYAVHWYTIDGHLNTAYISVTGKVLWRM